MPLPLITNVVRVAVSGQTSTGTAWANILHYRKTTGSIDAAAITALAAEIQKLYQTNASASARHLLTYCKTTTFANQVTFTPLDGTSASTVLSVNWPGTQTDDQLPAETSLVVTWRTALRGRRNRGRTYLPPFTEVNNTATGVIVSTIPAALAEQAIDHIADLTAVNWQLVVASYGGPSGTPPTTWVPYATTVTTATVSQSWDSQRRRGGK